MARRHNTTHVVLDAGLLNGVTAGLCPGGCGYRETNCGCPGGPRLNGGRHPVRIGGRCPGCGYMRATHCTCPGGPREHLS